MGSHDELRASILGESGTIKVPLPRNRTVRTDKNNSRKVRTCYAGCLRDVESCSSLLGGNSSLGDDSSEDDNDTSHASSL
eukprot:6482257-Amphidinium_carterae.1